MQIEFQILDALQKIHTPVLDGVMCLITSLGNAGIIWILLTIALEITFLFLSCGLPALYHSAGSAGKIIFLTL